jgi:hypothetical protein
VTPAGGGEGALRSAAQPARGGGSPEQAITGAPVHQTQQGLHLRHHDNVENLLWSPWEDVGQQWRLVWAWRLGASSVSMAAGSGAPPAKPRAPTWASVFGDPSRTVDLARAMARRRGGELNTVASLSIFAGQNSP